MELDLSDEALVEKFRQTGDAIYFKTLVRRYQNRIFSAAYRMLGSKEEAEEVTQDTFVRMHQNLDNFKRQATFGAWLFRIAHNQCIDVLRARQRKKGVKVLPFNPSSTLEPGEEDGYMIGQLADDGPSPGQSLDLSEQTGIIFESLKKLPETQRAVLVLHDIEGFSYQEIADIVGTNLGTVRSRLHYGRLKMKELLDPYFSTNSQPATSR